MDRTFVAVKPDGIQRGLCGEIINRLEQRGFKLVAAKLTQVSEDHMRNHYVGLKDRPVYDELCRYIASGPILAMVWEGQNIMKLVRMMVGETNPADSKPGTIRGDLCIVAGRNVLHASKTLENAKTEVDLWFKPEEIISYTLCTQPWLYENVLHASKTLENAKTEVEPRFKPEEIISYTLCTQPWLYE